MPHPAVRGSMLVAALLACSTSILPTDSSRVASGTTGAPTGTRPHGDTGPPVPDRTDTVPPTRTRTPPCQTDPSWTVGLQQWSPHATDGYTLFAPEDSGTTWLIDACGREVHRWERTDPPGQAVHLTPDGLLLRTEAVPSAVFAAGGRGGRIVALDWQGAEVWRVDYASDTAHHHHDAIVLPNGNLLFLAWELISGEEARAAGRAPELLWTDELWVDHLVELNPYTAEPVWRWRVWDHLVQDLDPAAANFGTISEYPGRINVNASATGKADWTHINSLAYDSTRDHVLVSVHGLGEVWVIDHASTTEEATGPLGELLYRWGHPTNYGQVGQRMLFGQHHASWLPDGDILVFNNGDGRPDALVSTVDQLTPPWNGSSYARGDEAWAPESLTWTWTMDGLFSVSMSGAQRLESGHTLVTDSSRGTFYEVMPDGNVVWQYINPVVNGMPWHQGEPLPETSLGTENQVFRAVHVPATHPGLSGRDLTPGDYLER